MTNGERIAINRTVGIYVPQGARVWLQVSGRECDEPAGVFVQSVSIFAHILSPCPANAFEQNPDIFDLFNNDDVGIILNTFRSATAAIGRHTATSVATANFPGTGPVTFGDGKQGQGDYELSYTVARG